MAPEQLMTGAELRAWQAQQGYTYDTAAAALGISRMTYARLLKADTLDKRTELACLAITEGLGKLRTKKIPDLP